MICFQRWSRSASTTNNKRRWRRSTLWSICLSTIMASRCAKILDLEITIIASHCENILASEMLRTANSGSLIRADGSVLESSTPTTIYTAEASSSPLVAKSASHTTTMVLLPLATTSPSSVVVFSMWVSSIWKMDRKGINTLSIHLMEQHKSLTSLIDQLIIIIINKKQ